MQGVKKRSSEFQTFPKQNLRRKGVLAVLLKGLEVLLRARAVNSDQEKPVLGDTCCRLA